MNLAVGSTRYDEISNYDASNALADATSVTGVLVVNGTDTGTTVTVTHPATGRYKISASLSGYVLGDSGYFRMTVTWNSKTFEIRCGEFVIAFAASYVVKATDTSGNALALASKQPAGIAGAFNGAPTVLDVMSISAAGRIWFVATTGNDSNDGTWGSPLLTIGAAVSAASDGDKIFVGVGTFDERVVLSKLLYLMGVSRELTIIQVDAGSNSGALNLGVTGCHVAKVRAVNTSTDVTSSVGITVAGGVNNVIIEDFYCSGPRDGMFLFNTNHSIIRRGTCASGFDGLQLTSSQNNLFEDLLCTTDASYNSGGQNCRCIVASSVNAKNNTFRRIQCTGTRNDTTAFDTIGIEMTGGKCVIEESCYISVTQSGVGSGGVYGIYDRSNTASRFIFSGTTVVTSNAGSGTTADIKNASGRMVDAGGNDYDFSKVSGTFPVMNHTDTGVLVRTTIATLSSQTSFTLSQGSTDDDAYNGAIAIVRNASTLAQRAVGTVLDYTGSTKTITLKADPAVFTMAAGNVIVLVGADTRIGNPSGPTIAADIATRAVPGDQMALTDAARKALANTNDSLSTAASGSVMSTVAASGGYVDSDRTRDDAIAANVVTLDNYVNTNLDAKLSDVNGNVQAGASAASAAASSANSAATSASSADTKLSTTRLAKIDRIQNTGTVASTVDVAGSGGGSLSVAQNAKLMSIDPNLATVASAIDDTGQLTLVQGNDYSLLPITFTATNTPDFSTAEVRLGIMSEADYDAGSGSILATITGSVTVADEIATFSFSPSPTNIAALLATPPNAPLDLVYEVRATISGKDKTTHMGACTVKRAVL